MKIEQLVSKVLISSVPPIDSIIELDKVIILHHTRNEKNLTVPPFECITKEISGTFQISYYVYQTDNNQTDFRRSYHHAITYVELVDLDWTMANSTSDFYYYLPVLYFPQKSLTFTHENR